jgi:hypothetical protein
LITSERLRGRTKTRNNNAFGRVNCQSVSQGENQNIVEGELKERPKRRGAGMAGAERMFYFNTFYFLFDLSGGL